MAVVVAGLPPSEIRQMTLGEINAVFEAKIKQQSGTSLSSADYDDMLDKFREARANDDRR